MRILLAAFTVLSACATALAGSGLIRDHDKDGDGTLSWEEVRSLGWNKDLFELKDMDGDGKISESDLFRHLEWLKKPVLNEKILRVLDTDGDGVLIKGKDWWWWDATEFDRFDINSDGTLDKRELAKIPRASPQHSAARKSR